MRQPEPANLNGPVLKLPVLKLNTLFIIWSVISVQEKTSL
jgi:hypothetical protein